MVNARSNHLGGAVLRPGDYPQPRSGAGDHAGSASAVHRVGAGESPTPGTHSAPLDHGHDAPGVAVPGGAAHSPLTDRVAPLPSTPAAGSVYAHKVTGTDGVTHLVGDTQHTAAYLTGGQYSTLCQRTIDRAAPTVAGTVCVACTVVSDRLDLADPFGLGGGRVLRWVRDAFSSR